VDAISTQNQIVITYRHCSSLSSPLTPLALCFPLSPPQGHESTIAALQSALARATAALQLEQQQHAAALKECHVWRAEEQASQRELQAARADSAHAVRAATADLAAQLADTTALLSAAEQREREHADRHQREVLSVRSAALEATEAAVAEWRARCERAHADAELAVGRATSDLYDRFTAERAARDAADAQLLALRTRFDAALADSRAVGAAEAGAERDLLEARIERERGERVRDVERARAESAREVQRVRAEAAERLKTQRDEHAADVTAVRARCDAELAVLRSHMDEIMRAHQQQLQHMQLQHQQQLRRSASGAGLYSNVASPTASTAASPAMVSLASSSALSPPVRALAAPPAPTTVSSDTASSQLGSPSVSSVETRDERMPTLDLSSAADAEIAAATAAAALPSSAAGSDAGSVVAELPVPSASEVLPAEASLIATVTETVSTVALPEGEQ
jgi:hypothetical protein